MNERTINDSTLTVPAFSEGCKKAGIAMIIIFGARIVTDLADYLMKIIFKGLDATPKYFIISIVSLALLYGVAPFLTAKALGLGKSSFKGAWKKPRRLGKAVSWVLPSYGAGQIINIVVLIISFLLLSNPNALYETYKPMVSEEQSVNFSCTIFMFIQMVVMAPIFEELWFRGIIEKALLPFGNGFAIMTSALCFGFAHGNLHQFSYTFVIGIMLGYVYYATGSLLPTTIIHAILNSVSGFIVLITSTSEFSSGAYKLLNGIEPTAAENNMVTILGTYMLVVFVFIIVGIICSISKIKNRRLFVPVNNNPALSKGQKFRALFSNPVALTGFSLCTLYIIAQIVLTSILK